MSGVRVPPPLPSLWWLGEQRPAAQRPQLFFCLAAGFDIDVKASSGNHTMTKVLVTGADGFIGSHLVEHLAKQGYDVTAFVKYNSFNSWGWLEAIETVTHKNLTVVSGDVTDFDSVLSVVRGMDAVLHLAALIAIPFSYHAPEAYIRTNVDGTHNILRAAKLLGTKKVVVTSTSETYGTAQYVPIDESHPINAQSPYAATKVAADQLALAYNRSFDLPVGILRPFNTYGPRQSARAVIPTIVSQLASGSPEVSLGSLSPTRDFLYVDDTVKGFVCALESDEIIGKAVNVGTGYEISIADTVSLIAEAMGKTAIVKHDKSRLRPENSEVDRLVANSDVAQDVLNWKPEFTGREGLLEGLRRTSHWFMRPENLEYYKTGQYNI